MVTLRIDPFPRQDELNMLWLEAWGSEGPKDSALGSKGHQKRLTPLY